SLSTGKLRCGERTETAPKLQLEPAPAAHSLGSGSGTTLRPELAGWHELWDVVRALCLATLDGLPGAFEMAARNVMSAIRDIAAIEMHHVTACTEEVNGAPH